MAAAYAARRPPHPVALEIAYPARMSRGLALIKWLLAIPQMIVVYLLVEVAQIITVLAWFAVLFTGRYPASFYEFTSGALRWQSQVMAYMLLLRDEYPPFSWEPGDYPLLLDIPPAERQSRWRLFVRLIAAVPSWVVFQFLLAGALFTTLMALVAILVTGRYPRGLFRFATGVLRWQARLFAYVLLLREEFPPYSLRSDARPGNEALSVLLALPLVALYVGVFALSFFRAGSATTGQAAAPSRVHVSREELRNNALASNPQPAAVASDRGLVLSLVTFDPDPFESARDLVKDHRVVVGMHVLRVSGEPARWDTGALEGVGCDGTKRSIAAFDPPDAPTFTRGPAHRFTAKFDLPAGEDLCEIDYRAPSTSITFVLD